MGTATITTDELKRMGCTFKIRGDEPYDYFVAVNKAGKECAWYNGNVLPERGFEVWERMPEQRP